MPSTSAAIGRLTRRPKNHASVPHTARIVSASIMMSMPISWLRHAKDDGHREQTDEHDLGAQAALHRRLLGRPGGLVEAGDLRARGERSSRCVLSRVDCRTRCLTRLQSANSYENANQAHATKHL